MMHIRLTRFIRRGKGEREADIIGECGTVLTRLSEIISHDQLHSSLSLLFEASIQKESLMKYA
ncbi:UNVERIFIED_CONTAM: hypothetical protein FKN15_031140 [Acipenser sinensis]